MDEDIVAGVIAVDKIVCTLDVKPFNDAKDSQISVTAESHPAAPEVVSWFSFCESRRGCQLFCHFGGSRVAGSFRRDGL